MGQAVAEKSLASIGFFWQGPISGKRLKDTWEASCHFSSMDDYTRKRFRIQWERSTGCNESMGSAGIFDFPGFQMNAFFV